MRFILFSQSIPCFPINQITICDQSTHEITIIFFCIHKQHLHHLKISQVCRMNQQNTSKTPDLPVKRKRGRPRKDESVPRNEKQPPLAPPAVAPAPPPATVMKTIQPPPPSPAAAIPASNNATKIDHTMVGQAVTCVIDGIFDNGYLLSTRMGPNNTILRGIVFQQGHICPVTPANDVAPHVEMSTRGEFPIPPSNPRNQIQFCTPESVCAKQIQPMAMQNYQNTPSMLTGGSSTSAPQESLRLVEQDDVMQVFEVSKTVEDHQEPQDCDQRAKNDHVVGSDPTAENFPESGTMIHEVQIQVDNLNPEFAMDAAIVAPQAMETVQPASQDMVQDEGDHKAMEREPLVNDASPNEPDGKNPELITPVEPVMEIPPSMGKDGVHQESKEQTGEVSNVDANQDPSREVAVDLSLSSFHEI